MLHDLQRTMVVAMIAVRMVQAPVDEGRFAAYSCGGSRSIERSLARTAFPFDPPKGNRRVKTY
jgi:hypothetical protein